MPIELVTFEHAKRHLRPPTDDDDVEISDKLAQATESILAFLKKRAHESSSTAVISTSSVASPTVITTESPHTFLDAASVFIAGHVDSVPALGGVYAVSSPTSDTFTVPIAVTTAGTGGTVSPVWTALTCPGPVRSAVLLLLTHLYEHRGDDMKTDADIWDAIGRCLRQFRDPALA